MNRLKTRLTKHPYTRALGRTVLGVSDHRVLSQLSNIDDPGAVAIQEALFLLKSDPLIANHYWVKRIEAQRNQLLSCDEVLVDGALGDCGPYDQGETVQSACHRASKRSRAAFMLYLLVRALNPTHVIELGTNVGISSAYISAALSTNDNDGRLTTIDVSPYRQRVAKRLHKNLSLHNISYVNGLFSDVLVSTLEQIGRIDLAFIDGHHQYQPTLDYFETIWQFASPDAVFIFDDIRWSAGMKKAWTELQSDPRFAIVIDLRSFGICTLTQDKTTSRFISPVIYSVL